MNPSSFDTPELVPHDFKQEYWGDNRAGQLLVYAELARDVGIAPNTAKRWVSVLETSQQVSRAWHRRTGRGRDLS